jgi:hypothetical protein
MNSEDKGLIHQHMAGRFVMNLRQWMVEHYSRRFRKEHWDGSLKEYREGYYVTTGKIIKSWAKALRHFDREAAIQWKDMTKQQKGNFLRAVWEHVLVGLLLGLSFALGEPSDYKKNWWMRMWIYQTKRALMEVKASTPAFITQEFTKMLNSPVAATSTVNSTLYPIYHIDDIGKPIKRGRYKGEDTWIHNTLKYEVPYWSQIDDVWHMDEEDNSFAVFNNTMR